MRQVTVMHGPERRRRWTDEERLWILAEAAAPGACVTDVARRHDISTARIYTWRHKLRHLFSPGIWWIGLIVNRSGSADQIFAMYSYGVRPLRVLSRRAKL